MLAAYNDLENVKALFESNKGEIAAIIVEPVAGNMGCIPPKDGFLQGLRDLCSANGALLIFDEATSALDYESESIIQANMRRISQGRTVFIIAHRLSAVKDAHRIMVVDKGRLVEQGNHQQLVAHGGIYAQLYSIQNHHGVGVAAKPIAQAPINPIIQNKPKMGGNNAS